MCHPGGFECSLQELVKVRSKQDPYVTASDEPGDGEMGHGGQLPSLSSIGLVRFKVVFEQLLALGRFNSKMVQYP